MSRVRSTQGVKALQGSAVVVKTTGASVRQIQCHIECVASRLIDVPGPCRRTEPRLVANDIIAAAALSHGLEQQRHTPAMVGVGGRARGHLAQQVAGDDRVGRGAADARTLV